jgi:cyclic pyranopterin phosphate synthase
LLREDLEGIVQAVSSVPGVRETVLTTNGLGLAGRADGLRAAGLDRVNLSLDTLDAGRFVMMAGADRHREVIDGLHAAADVFPTVKTNTVLLRGWNDDEIAGFVRFAGDCGISVRFLEYYAVPAAEAGLEGLRCGEILERIRTEFGQVSAVEGDPLSIERVYRVPGASGARIGLIESAGPSDCARCRKLRLTASGTLLPCLFAAKGYPVAEALRGGDVAEVRRAIRGAYGAKQGVRASSRAYAAARDIGG